MTIFVSSYAIPVFSVFCPLEAIFLQGESLKLDGKVVTETSNDPCIVFKSKPALLIEVTLHKFKSKWGVITI